MMEPTLDRVNRFSAFIAVAAGKPFIHGKSDCALLPADWCRAECGTDPAASVRGRYNSEAEWRALADAEGGLPALWRRLGTEAGLEQTASPGLGDIGLVTLLGYGIFGAIKGSENRWVVKLDSGIVGGDFAMIDAWGVPCHRR